MLVMILSAILIAAQSAVAAPNDQQTVYISYLDCGNWAGPVEVAIFRADGYGAPLDTKQKVVGRIHSFSLSLASGNYSLSISTRAGCLGDAMLTVLPSHNRHVFVIGGRTIHLRESLGSIAGTIPWAGLSIGATCKNSNGLPTTYPAIVDAGAYYIEHVDGPADCALMINTGWSAKVCTIAEIKVGYSARGRFIIRNLTWHELVSAAGCAQN